MKKGLSFEQHQNIGEELFRIREYIVHLCCEVGNAYPITSKKGKAYRELTKAYKSIDEARSELEEMLFKDFTNQADVHVYYPIRLTPVAGDAAGTGTAEQLDLLTAPLKSNG